MLSIVSAFGVAAFKIYKLEICGRLVSVDSRFMQRFNVVLPNLHPNGYIASDAFNIWIDTSGYRRLAGHARFTISRFCKPEIPSPVLFKDGQFDLHKNFKRKKALNGLL